MDPLGGLGNSFYCSGFGAVSRATVAGAGCLPLVYCQRRCSQTGASRYSSPSSIECGVYGDHYYNIPKAIFYLLMGDYIIKR